MASRVTYLAEAAARTTTTTTDYSVVKTSVTFTPTASKTYAIFWRVILDGSSTSFSTKARLQNTTDSTTLAENIQRTRHATIATSNTSAGGMALYTASGSPVSQTIQLQVASGDASMTMGVQEASIFVIELIDSVDIWGSSLADGSTTSSTYGGKVTLSWTPATAGSYLTFASAEMQASGVAPKNRLFIDNATAASESTQNDWVDAADWQMYVAAYRHDTISGAHTARLDWGSVNAVTATIRNAYMVSLRLSGFDSYFWGENRTQLSSTTLTWADSATATGTPSAVRYLALACGHVDQNSAYGLATGMRIAVDGVAQGAMPSIQRSTAGKNRHWIDFRVRTEAVASTTWATQFQRSVDTGPNVARTDENVLAVLQIDAVYVPPQVFSVIGVGAASSGDHDDVLSPALPAGIGVGDLLIAFGYLRNAGTLDISAGWTEHYLLDVTTAQQGVYAPSSFYLKVWYRFATGSDASPSITVVGGSTGPQSLTLSFVTALRFVDRTTPFGTHGADSFNITANPGPIAAPTGLPANGAVLALAIRNSTVWTSAQTLDGDGLTWVEDFDNYTNTVGGLGISLVMNHAVWSGTAPSLTAKTFTTTGGSIGPTFGKIFVVNAASEDTPPLTRNTQLAANAAVATPISLSVSADCSVEASTGITVGAVAPADHDDVMTPAVPDGVTDGDVLFLLGYLRNAGELNVSAGWTEHSLTDAAQGIYLRTWYTIYDGSLPTPTVTITGGSTSPQTLAMSFIIAARGYNQAVPLSPPGPDSINQTQATIGPISPPASLPSAGTVIVTGFRNGTVWTSAPTLSGDGLSWNELFDNYTNTVAGLGISAVADYATWSGIAPPLTAKTFSPVGGASNPALGKMFVFNKDELVSTTQSVTLSANAVVVTKTSIIVSADASVVSGTKSLSLSANANVIRSGTFSVSLSANASVVRSKFTASQILYCDAVIIPPIQQEGVLTAVGELSAERTDTAWLVLLTLSHPDLPNSIRVTSDGVPTTSLGNTFSPFPFQIVLPDDVEGRAPQAQLGIDNTTQEIIAILRGLTTPAVLTVQIVRSVNPDVIEFQWVGFEWSLSTYDKNTITGTLTFMDISREEFPYITMDSRWVGLLN